MNSNVILILILNTKFISTFSFNKSFNKIVRFWRIISMSLEKGKCQQDFKLNSFADFSNKANVFYTHTLISKNPKCQPFFSIDLNNKRWKNNKYLVKFDHLIQLCL